MTLNLAWKLYCAIFYWIETKLHVVSSCWILSCAVLHWAGSFQCLNADYQSRCMHFLVLFYLRLGNVAMNDVFISFRVDSFSCSREKSITLILNSANARVHLNEACVNQSWVNRIVLIGNVSVHSQSQNGKFSVENLSHSSSVKVDIVTVFKQFAQCSLAKFLFSDWNSVIVDVIDSITCSQSWVISETIWRSNRMLKTETKL